MHAPRPDRVFDQLSEYLDDTGDLQQAMRRLVQRGMKNGEEKIAGLDELLSQLAREMRRLYERYQIRSALDQVGEKLQSLLAKERETLEKSENPRPELEMKERFLDQLPDKKSEAIEKLASYDFENSEARQEFEQLLRQLEGIRRLEHTVWREGNLFRGRNALGL